jgi:type I restriction-modification system DNA methylase subunit
MKLINHVLEIRRHIQQAFDNRFSRMGLRAEASITVDQLPDELLERRHVLDNIMANHLEEFHGDYPQARLATVNECVFTLFNRIAAIKVMEAKELFPEIIRRRKENAGRSFEHNAWLETHPEERQAEREGLKHFLIEQFDTLGEHIPLYRSDYPYALLPTADELNEIIDLFNAVDEDADCGEATWKQDDILGWLYENFNAVEKDALKSSGEKTEYNKVSLQSQVYTPQWVVKFLVDNTLGKTYLEMYPDSDIKNRYQIANAPDHCVRTPREVTSLKVLDPACGSGNFLIYAFSLLYDLYIDQMEHYGKDYNRREIPKMIVENNLYGVDLDERAAQISQIALFIKARDLGGHRSKWPEFTNVVSSHFYLVDYENVRSAFESIEDLNQSKRNIMHMVWNDLSNAYKFGSLVRVDETLQSLITEDTSSNLFAQQDQDDMFSFRNQFMTELRNKVDEWGSQGSNPYTLAQTNDAITFLNIISQKFDVVVANPPYTDSADFGPELKGFIEDNYKKPYKFNSNLYATFIKRNYELATDDGKIGMIHPMTFMYIKTFEDVRKFILENTHINLFVEYGLSNLFGTVMVDPSFYVLEKGESVNPATFISLDQYTRTPEEKNKKRYCLSDLNDICAGRSNSRIYTLPQSKLKSIKSYPFIYWISDEFRSKFSNRILSDIADPKVGINSGSNEQFVRFWWEVDMSEDWKGYAKGGPYNKWYGNDWLKINWANDGEEIKKAPKSILRNSDYYFREGITYSASGSKGASFRYLPENHIFDVGGSCIFPKQGCNLYELLAILNTTVVSYISECLNPTVNKQVGDMLRIPIPTVSSQRLQTLAQQNITIKKRLSLYSLIEPVYTQSPIEAKNDVLTSIRQFFDFENAALTKLLLNEAIINRIVIDLYELSEADKQMVLDKEGIPVGDLPVSHAAKEAYKEWLAANQEFKAADEVLAHLEALEERQDIDPITDFETLYQNNNGWEEFCIKHQVNPVEAWYQFKNAHILPPQRTQTLAFELLTDVIRTVLAKDDDGVIPLNEKLGEERLSLRIEREFMERGYSSGQFSQVCQLLGCNLEKYLMERFFQQLSDHLNLFMYLPKTPFIWHLTSGEHHALELYVSIYTWSRDTLYRVRSIYAANRESVITARLNALDTSQTEGRLEAQELRAQLAELKQFCAQVDDLLAEGYDPKLDDGVGKNIAPLQKRGMLSYEVLNAGQLKKYLNADW